MESVKLFKWLFIPTAMIAFPLTLMKVPGSFFFFTILTIRFSCPGLFVFVDDYKIYRLHYKMYTSFSSIKMCSINSRKDSIDAIVWEHNSTSIFFTFYCSPIIKNEWREFKKAQNFIFHDVILHNCYIFESSVNYFKND